MEPKSSRHRERKKTRRHIPRRMFEFYDPTTRLPFTQGASPKTSSHRPKPCKHWRFFTFTPSQPRPKVKPGPVNIDASRLFHPSQNCPHPFNPIVNAPLAAPACRNQSFQTRAKIAPTPSHAPACPPWRPRDGESQKHQFSRFTFSPSPHRFLATHPLPFYPGCKGTAGRASARNASTSALGICAETPPWLKSSLKYPFP